MASSSHTAAALIVVDVQPDFCEGGALPAAGGNDLAERIATYLAADADRFDVIVATRDAHVQPGDHFAPVGTEPDYGTSWPVHCVEGTPGAELHPAIAGLAFDAVVAKGAYAGATDGFEGVTAGGERLADVLRGHHVTDVYVAGLVYEVCDADTALGALAAGFRAHLVADLCVALDPVNIPGVNQRLEAAGVTITTLSPGCGQTWGR
jgi:nicotinamidase/pyrazinamidase